MMNRINKLPILILSLLLVTGVFLPSSRLNPVPIQAQDIPFVFEYYMPIFYHNHQPLFSTSYYLITINETLLYNLGCELGTRDSNTNDAQDNVAVLNFSYPVCNEEENCFGADLYGFGPVMMEDIAVAVKNFALGYYTCTGHDNDSSLVIGMGTNNKPTSCDTEEKMAAHGKAWAETIRDLNLWSINKGIFHQVQFYGANNFELGWNTPVMTRAWLDGFEQVGGTFLLNFGDAAGCPYEDKPSWSCQGDWTQEDVWYISYGSPAALPLPLIYLTNGVHAKQWASLSQYSVRTHGYRMDIIGTFTQWQACGQRSCNGTDNTPYDAYNQLFSELKKSPATAQDLRWKTDIRWTTSNEIPQSNLTSEAEGDSIQAHQVQEEIDYLQDALQTANLSEALRSSLEQKYAIYQTIAEGIRTSLQNRASKDQTPSLLISASTDPEFTTGIFTGGAIPWLPYNTQINNSWQTITSTGYLQVAAGTSPGDKNRGAIYIVETSFNKAVSKAFYLQASSASGSLTILEELNNQLLIQSETGSRFIFDLPTRTLLLDEQ